MGCQDFRLDQYPRGGNADPIPIPFRSPSQPHPFPCRSHADPHRSPIRSRSHPIPIPFRSRCSRSDFTVTKLGDRNGIGRGSGMGSAGDRKGIGTRTEGDRHGTRGIGIKPESGIFNLFLHLSRRLPCLFGSWSSTVS